MKILQRIHHRYIYLLASLMFLLLADPFLTGEALGFSLVDLGLFLTLASSIVSVSRRRFQMVLGLLMLGIIIAMRVAEALSQSSRYGIAYLALCLVFLVYSTVLMSRDIFTAQRVTIDTICGSLSVFMLMGIAFAFAFLMLETVVPGSFDFPSDEIAPGEFPMRRLLSFSFVTLTTLGYGNITPANPRADALCTAEAILGQIYITVLVARLVALQIYHANRDAEGGAT